MRSNKQSLLIAGIVAVIVITALSYMFICRATEYVVPILMYHSVDGEYKNTKLSVSLESFTRQMEFLRKNNYNVIPLEKAVTYIKKREKPPAKTIAITFDDGFHNNYQSAYPVLKKYRIPATIFVIVNRVGNPGFLSWEEIREMSDFGIITIGSHTRSHFWLLESDPRFLEDEIVNSKKILEDKLGRKVNLFCYPMGAFDAQSKKAVERAGYTCAVSTNPLNVSPLDVFAIKRVKISCTADNMFVFWAETTRLYTWFKRYKGAE